MKTEFSSALRIFTFFTVLTGIAYPALVTGVAKIGFKGQAKVLSLIGQKFESPTHFWSRPSATDYNPMPSGGSNLGPTSADLKAKLGERLKQGRVAELLVASASGLDPDIRPETARLQVPRIVQALKLPADRQVALTKELLTLIDVATENRQFGIFGDPHVNVLRLNLALDERLNLGAH